MSSGLIREGFYYIPIAKRSKQPIKGFNWNEKVLTYEQAEEYLRQGYNLAIHTGKSGLLVVDIDVKNKEWGELNIIQLAYKMLAYLGVSQETLTVRTQSGGLHLYYKLNNAEEEQKIPGQFLLTPSVDLQTGNSYVIIPPSKLQDPTTGEIREWGIERDDPIVEFPVDAWEKVKEYTGYFSQIKSKHGETFKKMLQPVYEGTRNETLKDYLCFLKDHLRLPEKEAREIIHIINYAVFEPPLDIKEVESVRYPPKGECEKSWKRFTEYIAQDNDPLEKFKQDIKLLIVTTDKEEELIEGLEAKIKEYIGSKAVQEPRRLNREGFKSGIKRRGQGLETGISEELDRRVKIPVGAITVVAGRPGHGKTTFMLNMLLGMSDNNPDKKFYFFSYEQTEVELGLRLIAHLIGEVDEEKPTIDYITEGIQREDPEVEEIVDKFMSDYIDTERINIIYENLPPSLLEAYILKKAQEQNIGAIFIDYIQKIVVGRPDNRVARYEIIQVVSDKLNRIAKLTNIPIIVGAQFNRDTEKIGKKETESFEEYISRKLNAINLRESGDIEQDASLILGLYKPTKKEIEEIKQGTSNLIDNITGNTVLYVSVLKNREGDITEPIALPVNWGTMRVGDWVKENEDNY